MQMIDLVPDLQPTIMAARQMRDDRNSLAQYLPYVEKMAIRYRMARRTRLDQTAPIRGIDAPATPIRRPGVVDVKGDLPSITPAIDLTEQDQQDEFILAQQLAGQFVDWTDVVNDAAGTAAITVDNTFEMMRGQVLTTGIVSLTAEDGITSTVDFEIPAANKILAGAPIDPANPAAAFAILKAAGEQFIDSSGDAAGVALTTQAVYNVFLAALQNKFPMQPLTGANLNAYLVEQKLPPLATNDRKFVGANGVKTRVFPQGYLTLMSGGPVGETQLGVTQHAVQQVVKGTLKASQAPGLTIVTVGEDDPPRKRVLASAMGLPVLRDNEDIVVVRGLVA